MDTSNIDIKAVIDQLACVAWKKPGRSHGQLVYTGEPWPFSHLGTDRFAVFVEGEKPHFYCGIHDQDAAKRSKAPPCTHTIKPNPEWTYIELYQYIADGTTLVDVHKRICYIYQEIFLKIRRVSAVGGISSYWAGLSAQHSQLFYDNKGEDLQESSTSVNETYS